MQILKFISTGKVQGVYYRKHITQAMNKEHIKGYIKNLPDGTAECVIKNDSNLEINKILDILYTGSPKSSVESVQMEVADEEISFSPIFEVRY